MPDDIYADIQEHTAYKELRKLFACEKEGLESLLLMLGESTEYAIGVIDFSLEELLQFSEVITDDIGLAGWVLLANKNVRDLLRQSVGSENNPLKPILKSLSEECYPTILNNLRLFHEQASINEKSKVIKLFNAYLTLFSQSQNALELLQNTKLLNQEGRWVLAEQLCVDIEGIDDSSLLNREQSSCLGAIIHSGKQVRTTNNHSFVVSDSMLLQSTPNTLKTYFKDWEGLVENELIGFFISLLGSQVEIEEVAEGFLGNRSVEGVRNKISWLASHGDGQNTPLFNGFNQHESIKQMTFLIHVEDSDSIKVSSIFNEPIVVSLHSKPRTIIINHNFSSQYEISFQLRKLNFSDWSESDLSFLLKNSAAFILKTVYEQSSELEKIWADLGESDQLDIAVARGLILDELPANLRQLALQRSDIQKSLQHYQNAKALRKELEITQGETGEADKNIKLALEEMQNALIKDEETQQAVLGAIKSKIANHQYQKYSVPFELFQNADDAVFEYAEMQAYPDVLRVFGENVIEGQQSQYHVLYDENTLLFIHWGRAINYFRGSEGFPGKERGFHRDLEKMLLMNTSDKQAEDQVTGKFGLGFKSVYLVSDRPKILSGRLGVEVFAAMLPNSLRENDRKRLKSKIEQLSNTNLTATAIELPLTETEGQECVLRKFDYYAGILVVFSKAIKRIIFNQDRAVTWSEKCIFEELPEVRVGCLSLAEKKTKALKFVFTEEEQKYDLLFAFGANGFEKFPYKIEQEVLPKIWILAPTHDESSIGFLINAGFDVDMGRMQLAHESNKNERIVLQMGRSLAHVCEQLDAMINDDWAIVREQFDLAADVTPYKFWRSFWLVLISSWVRKDDNKVHQLVRNMLTLPSSSFIRLLSKKSLLPNGLWNDFQMLVSLPTIKYTLKGVLGQDKFFNQVQGQLANCAQAEELIHEKVQDELFKLLSEDDCKTLGWLTFDLVTLAEKSILNKKVSLQLGSLWGDLLSIDLLDELSKTEALKKEHQHLEKFLSTVTFLNYDQQFKQVSDLLDSQYADDEEKLRAAFAPNSNILSKEYDKKGAEFFRFSRKKIKATLEQMEQWAINAPDLKKQVAVLAYLLKGDRNDELADKLRNQPKGTWLKDLSEQSEHFNGWLKSDVTKVLKRKLATDEEMDRLNINMEEDIEESLNPEIVLTNVYNWWLQNKETYLNKYNRTIYPSGIFPDLINSDESVDRDGWMTLLFLGSLNTMGRTKDAQHREAIRHFKDKGWWDVFIQAEPQETPEKWMHVLDEYLKDQFYGSQYESWMMRFVTIYRFARWLDEYAYSWLAIKQQSTKFSLDDVLNTTTSQVHAGGGISAPVLSRTLGIGANFILRELVRHNVLNSASAIISSEHCFVAHKRVRELLNKLEMNLDENVASSSQSQDIYKFISHYLGKDQATFDFSFDIPFQFIARDISLQEQLFCNTSIESNFVINNGLMKAPAWAWDLLDNIPFYVALVKDNHLTEPVVGYELNDPDGIVLFELELAWEQDKVGVIIDDEYEFWEEIQKAQEFGWQVFTIDELKDEDELVRFLSCFNR